MGPIQAATASATQGRVQEAIRLLETAGASGDVAALYQLAIWYLSGHIVPRNLAAARSALARAVAIGHVDAALMQVALTANGSGAKPDWAGAISLLRQAAANDPLAAQHLELLGQMGLQPDGAPRQIPSGQRLHDHPRVQRFASLCTPAECEHIASIAAPSLQPAKVFDPASGKMVPHPIRSSDNAPVGPTRESLVIQAINRRIAAATETDVTQGEPLTVLRYSPGQQYRPHLDTLTGEPNQRTRTAILYLNHNYTGGQTVFPLLGLEVAPRGGDLLVFDNVDAHGAPDPNSRHAGLPVTGGTKWIATRWIRAEPTSPWLLSEQARAASRG